MAHKEALFTVMQEGNVTKAELARRCGYSSRAATIISRLNNDIQIPKPIAMANVPRYEAVLQPKPKSDDWRSEGWWGLDEKPDSKLTISKGGDAK